jgi:hypothetical protein
MTTDTGREVVTKPAEKASVHPATLGIRDLTQTREGFETVTVAGVYGGAEGKVWVATFADPNEAQAFILASNHFKQPVNGYILGDTEPKVEVHGARVEGRKPTDTVN